MTLTISLSPEAFVRLREVAQPLGLTPEEYAGAILTRELSQGAVMGASATAIGATAAANPRAVLDRITEIARRARLRRSSGHSPGDRNEDT